VEACFVEKIFLWFSIRCTDYPLKTNSTLTIFKLLLATRPIISEELNWIPGNGKWIRPWEDEIMESDRLVHLAPLLPICKWLEAQGIASLSKLSSWSSNGSWLSWVNPRSPPHLSPLFFKLISSLQGCAPCHRRIKDMRGWGQAQYIVNNGYSLLVEEIHNQPLSSTWTSIWHSNGIPKVQLFLLAPGTQENLHRRKSKKEGDLWTLSMHYVPKRRRDSRIYSSSAILQSRPRAMRWATWYKGLFGHILVQNSSINGEVIIWGTSRKKPSLKDFGMLFPNTFVGAFGSLAINESSMMKSKAQEWWQQRLVLF
jgi:hypothetical protein